MRKEEIMNELRKEIRGRTSSWFIFFSSENICLFDLKQEWGNKIKLRIVKEKHGMKQNEATILKGFREFSERGAWNSSTRWMLSRHLIWRYTRTCRTRQNRQRSSPSSQSLMTLMTRSQGRQHHLPAHQTLFLWYPRLSPLMASRLPLLSHSTCGPKWSSIIPSSCPGWSSSR